MLWLFFFLHTNTWLQLLKHSKMVLKLHNVQSMLHPLERSSVWPVVASAGRLDCYGKQCAALLNVSFGCFKAKTDTVRFKTTRLSRWLRHPSLWSSDTFDGKPWSRGTTRAWRSISREDCVRRSVVEGDNSVFHSHSAWSLSLHPLCHGVVLQMMLNIVDYCSKPATCCPKIFIKYVL